jgi:hypothetical protein
MKFLIRVLKVHLVVGWMLLIFLPLARATTIVPMDLADLTTNAELIFIGTVTDISSERDARTIYSYVTFSDLEVLKGTYLEETIEVRLSGGTVAGETVQVVGMPKFVIGERNLIFLAGNFKFVCPIVGWGQGRFKILRDEITGQEMVFDNSDIPVVEIEGNKIIRARKSGITQGSAGVPEGLPKVVDRAAGSIKMSQEVEKRLTVESFISAIEKKMGIRP